MDESRQSEGRGGKLLNESKRGLFFLYRPKKAINLDREFEIGYIHSILG